MVKITKIVFLGTVVCPSLMDCAAALPKDSLLGSFDSSAIDADGRLGIARASNLFFDDIYKRKHNLIEPKILAAYPSPLKSSLDDDDDNYSDDDDDEPDDDEDFAYPNVKRVKDTFSATGQPMANSSLDAHANELVAAATAKPLSNEPLDAENVKVSKVSKPQANVNVKDTGRLLMGGLDSEETDTAINGISNSFQKWNESFRGRMNEFFQRINDTIKENGGMALLEYGDSFL